MEDSQIFVIYRRIFYSEGLFISLNSCHQNLEIVHPSHKPSNQKGKKWRKMKKKIKKNRRTYFALNLFRFIASLFLIAQKCNSSLNKGRQYIEEAIIIIHAWNNQPIYVTVNDPSGSSHGLAVAWLVGSAVCCLGHGFESAFFSELILVYLLLPALHATKRYFSPVHFFYKKRVSFL